jgi:hypothetical protein
VERERVWLNRGYSITSARAGLHFLRLLETYGVSPDSRDRIRTFFALRPPVGDPPLDAKSEQFLRVMAGRAPDGDRLHQELAPKTRWHSLKQFREEYDIPAGDHRALEQAVEAWLAWYDSLYAESAGRQEAWISERMEYAFSVSAPVAEPSEAEAETVLTASEYTGRDLDWFHFSHHPQAAIGAAADEASPALVQTFLPAPVSFRGMPASRWWEMEDSEVDLGKINTAPEDLSRMILVEFALTYGNDWIVIPLDLKIGSILQVRSLRVRNSFGEVTTVEPVSQKTPDAPWRMFTLSLDPRAKEGQNSQAEDTSLFFLAPTLPAGLQSPPLEEVRFIRDEMANLGWGIERIAPGKTGLPVNRYEAHQQQRGQEPEQETQRLTEAEIAYRLATDVPSYWIPLVPRAQDGRHMDFKRGLLLNTETGHPGRPWGRVLEPDLIIFEEEVPRAGIYVRRGFQYSRWIRGARFLWMGRKKETGRGPGSSGLRYDVVEAV